MKSDIKKSIYILSLTLMTFIHFVIKNFSEIGKYLISFFNFKKIGLSIGYFLQAVQNWIAVLINNHAIVLFLVIMLFLVSTVSITKAKKLKRKNGGL